MSSFPATPRQLAAITVTRQEDLIKERFVSVTRKYKLRLMTAIGGFAKDSQCELVLLPIIAGKSKDSRLQFLHSVAAGFQRGISHPEKSNGMSI